MLGTELLSHYLSSKPVLLPPLRASLLWMLSGPLTRRPPPTQRAPFFSDAVPVGSDENPQSPLREREVLGDQSWGGDAPGPAAELAEEKPEVPEPLTG